MASRSSARLKGQGSQDEQPAAGASHSAAGPRRSPSPQPGPSHRPDVPGSPPRPPGEVSSSGSSTQHYEPPYDDDVYEDEPDPDVINITSDKSSSGHSSTGWVHVKLCIHCILSTT